MKRLFLVCGPESAGNRLVAAYLHRAGVEIDASTTPQLPEASGSAAQDVGLIVHYEPKLSRAVEAARKNRREVRMVVLTREIGALVASMVERGHVTCRSDAIQRARLAHMGAMEVAIRFDLPFVDVSYESLVLHPKPTVRHMLRVLDLPTDNLDSEIMVQRQAASPVPVDRNADRYAA